MDLAAQRRNRLPLSERRNPLPIRPVEQGDITIGCPGAIGAAFEGTRVLAHEHAGRRRFGLQSRGGKQDQQKHTRLIVALLATLKNHLV
jgi:hypothetical protein